MKSPVVQSVLVLLALSWCNGEFLVFLVTRKHLSSIVRLDNFRQVRGHVVGGEQRLERDVRRVRIGIDVPWSHSVVCSSRWKRYQFSERRGKQLLGPINFQRRVKSVNLLFYFLLFFCLPNKKLRSYFWNTSCLGDLGHTLVSGNSLVKVSSYSCQSQTAEKWTSKILNCPQLKSLKFLKEKLLSVRQFSKSVT